LLIDQSGTIVWMGHPAERNLEKDIKTLIRGEKIELDKSDEFIEMIPDYADIKN
jgi:hypothetical protein